MDINIRIAGEAGQGVMTTGGLLVQSFASLGLNVAATRSYMSRIRGGLNWYDVRIGDRPLFGPVSRVNLLVALTDVAKDILQGEVAHGGLILHNGGSEAEAVVAIDLDAIAKEVGGSKLYSNAAAAGAVFGLLSYEPRAIEGLLEEKFAEKGQEVVLANRNCVRKGV